MTTWGAQISLGIMTFFFYAFYRIRKEAGLFQDKKEFLFSKLRTLYNEGYRIKLVSENISSSFHDCSQEHKGTLSVYLYSREDLQEEWSNTLGQKCTCLKYGPCGWTDISINDPEFILIRE